MKKLLTISFLCLLSISTFAANHLKEVSKTPSLHENYLPVTTTYSTQIDEQKAACSATVTINVFVGGEYVGSVSETRTVTTDDQNFNCSFAMSWAQSAAQDSANALAAQYGGYIPE